MMDDIVVLYFLKAIEANKAGNIELSNVRCCIHSSAILSIFIYHLYKIGDFNPTGGLSLRHIYVWILKNKEKYNNREIKAMIDKLQN